MLSDKHSQGKGVIVIENRLHAKNMRLAAAVCDDRFGFPKIPFPVAAVALQDCIELRVGYVSKLDIK